MSFFEDRAAPVFIAGHRGLVGSALSRKLTSLGFNNLLARTRQELDLTNQEAVFRFFKETKPKYVFMAAAKVGGIKANAESLPEFLYENLVIQCNVIKAAVDSGVSKFLFLGSSCIYPRSAPQPLKEEYLLTGALEPTNEGYALAKITGLKLCEYYNRYRGLKFISAMPTNLYGIEDNFHPEKSHVIPGLLVRFHQAKIHNAPLVEVWGTGTPRRDFLYAEDCVDALVTLMDRYDASETVNIGFGEDVTIRALAETVAKVVGFKGKITFNPNYPDGTPRKLLDISKISALGWQPRVNLEDGLKRSYEWALKNNRL